MSEKSLLARAETCAILYDDGHWGHINFQFLAYVKHQANNYLMKQDSTNTNTERPEELEERLLRQGIPAWAFILLAIGIFSTILVGLAAFGILPKSQLTFFKKFDQGNFIAEGMSLLIEASLLGVLLGIILPNYLERKRQNNEKQRWQPMADFAEGQLVEIATDLINLDIVDGTKGKGWFFRDHMNLDHHDFDSAKNIIKIDANLEKLANLSCGPSTPHFMSRTLKLRALVKLLLEAVRTVEAQRRRRFIQEWDMKGLIVHPHNLQPNTWSVLVAEILAELELQPFKTPAENTKEIRHYYRHAENNFDTDEWQARSLRYISAIHNLFHMHRMILTHIHNEFGGTLEDYTVPTLHRVLAADFTKGNLILEFDKST